MLFQKVTVESCFDSHNLITRKVFLAEKNKPNQKKLYKPCWGPGVDNIYSLKNI